MSYAQRAADEKVAVNRELLSDSAYSNESIVTKLDKFKSVSAIGTVRLIPGCAAADALQIDLLQTPRHEP